jgi:methylamine dehydrogenase accessory protein MauD
MDDVFVISHVTLWLVVLAQGFIIIALMRQVGVLLLRVGSSSAFDAGTGPALGNAAPWTPATADDDERLTLLAFVSTSCGSCDAIVPGLNAVARDYRDTVRVQAITRESVQASVAWADSAHLRIPITSSVEAFEAYQIDGTPYSFVVDRAGRVRGRGGINHIEHIESLVRTCLSDDQVSNPDEIVLVAPAPAEGGSHG